MKPRLPIPTGLGHSAQGCRVGEANLGHLVDYFPQRGCITVLARGFNPVGVGFPFPGSPRVAGLDSVVPLGQTRSASGFGLRVSELGLLSALGFQSYLATPRGTLLPKLLSGELSVAKIVLSGVNE